MPHLIKIFRLDRACIFWEIQKSTIISAFSQAKKGQKKKALIIKFKNNSGLTKCFITEIRSTPSILKGGTKMKKLVSLVVTILVYHYFLIKYIKFL